VRKFEVVGRHPVPPDLQGAPKQRIVPEKERKMPRKKQCIEVVNKKNPPDIKVTYEATLTCHGEWCSQHGVEFVTCLTVCVPVNSVSIPLVARECVFATQKFSNMIARDKRFLLYYYYATTIYQFHGKEIAWNYLNVSKGL